jgi:hypothetical protein
MCKGDKYSKVRKVYHVNLLYFKLGIGKDYVYRGHTEFIGIHEKDVLQLTEAQKIFFAQHGRMVNKVKDLFPEYSLLCIEDFDNIAKDNLDQWIYYFKNNVIPDNFEAPGLNAAREQLQYDKLSEQEKIDYEHHIKQRLQEQSAIDTAVLEGRLEGIAEGKAIGLKKGITQWEAIGLKKGEAQMQEKTVINSHKAGLSLETISNITALSQQQITEILEKHNR